MAFHLTASKAGKLPFSHPYPECSSQCEAFPFFSAQSRLVNKSPLSSVPSRALDMRKGLQNNGMRTGGMAVLYLMDLVNDVGLSYT